MSLVQLIRQRMQDLTITRGELARRMRNPETGSHLV